MWRSLSVPSPAHSLRALARETCTGAAVRPITCVPGCFVCVQSERARGERRCRKACHTRHNGRGSPLPRAASEPDQISYFESLTFESPLPSIKASCAAVTRRIAFFEGS